MPEADSAEPAVVEGRFIEPDRSDQVFMPSKNGWWARIEVHLPAYVRATLTWRRARPRPPF